MGRSYPFASPAGRPDPVGYVASLMGDNHYRRYRDNRRRTHPGEPILSEAEYWRMRHRRSESDPAARCC